MVVEVFIALLLVLITGVFIFMFHRNFDYTTASSSCDTDEKTNSTLSSQDDNTSSQIRDVRDILDIARGKSSITHPTKDMDMRTEENPTKKVQEKTEIPSQVVQDCPVPSFEKGCASDKYILKTELKPCMPTKTKHYIQKQTKTQKKRKSATNIEYPYATTKQESNYFLIHSGNSDSEKWIPVSQVQPDCQIETVRKVEN